MGSPIVPKPIKAMVIMRPLVVEQHILDRLVHNEKYIVMILAITFCYGAVA
ncbi:hypothetical protein OGV25_14425 [Pseudomonas sp. P1B16]|uniref:Uncharacterized protein n=1 Tax=Pseudomonas capeferrum TaxID=1495066 RepID=A0ABY7R3S0_9PSED|nr:MULTISPECIES: hypothetical protein [Pseudomonas]MBC3504596.1 hypothetical protein [Pseudomonas sp. SWRI59]MBC3508155.1 hypothetical protein [Pseudomonas sp. SWRI68]MCH7300762.1 hypothetical protein [Pseudomonas capeferrum]MDD2064090.1 hypothetical protein [Pseudomonas sp. 25571]UVL01727.1 hypothetical protein LOY26_14765 [Pseudomonas sp. B21-047]